MGFEVAEKAARERIDKFAERRAELAQAAVRTLSELGYARTSLREIALNSEFSHGVLHYYFKDKVDLITYCVRQYKAYCITRYDDITANAAGYAALRDGFVEVFGATMRDEAHLHRLWYDLRSQALFEPAFHADVAEIDKSLEQMIWRVMSRLYDFSDAKERLPPALLYALFDGVFQQALLKHLSGDQAAITEMQDNAKRLAANIFQTVPAKTQP